MSHWIDCVHTDTIRPTEMIGMTEFPTTLTLTFSNVNAMQWPNYDFIRLSTLFFTSLVYLVTTLAFDETITIIHVGEWTSQYSFSHSRMPLNRIHQTIQSFLGNVYFYPSLSFSFSPFLALSLSLFLFFSLTLSFSFPPSSSSQIVWFKLISISWRSGGRWSIERDDQTARHLSDIVNSSVTVPSMSRKRNANKIFQFRKNSFRKLTKLHMSIRHHTHTHTHRSWSIDRSIHSQRTVFFISFVFFSLARCYLDEKCVL